MLEQVNVWETVCEYLRNSITWGDVTFREEWNTVNIPQLLVMVDLGPTDETSLTLNNFGSNGYSLSATLNFNLSVWANLMKYEGSVNGRAEARRKVIALRDRITRLFKENNKNYILLKLKQYVDEDGTFTSTGIDTGRKVKVEPIGEWVKVPEADKNYIHFSRFYRASWESLF